MSVLGISKTDDDEKNGAIYSFDNCVIKFDNDTGSAIVTGRYPLDLALLIFENYPCDKYGIKAGGGNKSPFECLVDDEYVAALSNIFKNVSSPPLFSAGVKDARKKLRKRNNLGKYIPAYGIERKEGLVAFLAEVCRFFKSDKINIDKFDDYMAQISYEMLKQVNPSILPCVWMRNDPNNCNFFKGTVDRDKSDKHLQNLRHYLDAFACSVNPFLITDLSVDNLDFKRYLQSVSIGVNAWSEASGVKRDNCCSIVISSLDNNANKTYFSREVAGFVCELRCEFSKDDYLRLSYSFSMEKTGGEVIYISRSDSTGNSSDEVYYNHTNSKIQTSDGDWRDATAEDIDLIIDWVKRAASCGCAITLRNVSKKIK